MSSVVKKAAGFAGAAALLVLSGAAGPDQDFVRNTDASAQTCFHIRDVEGYSPAKIADREGVNLRLKNQDVFQMEFIEPCQDAKLATRIKIQSNSVTDYVCSGADASLVVRNESGTTSQCRISGLRKLSKAQVSALPENEQP
jgi:hypothetical protein